MSVSVELAPSRGIAVVDRLGLAAIVLLLLVTPWPLGSRLPWAGAAAATFAVVMSGAWLGTRLLLGERLRVGPPFVPVVLFMALSSLQWLTGHTIYAFATATELLSHTAYAGTMLLVCNVASGHRGSRILVGTILFVGLAVAVFGIVQHFTWNGLLFWFYEPPMGGTSPFGPFNNRNHFAGYMLAAIGPALGMMLAPGARGWRLAGAVSFGAGALAIVISLSRGGMLAIAGMGLLVLMPAAIAASRNGGLTARRMLAPLVAASVAAALVAGGLHYLGQTGRVLARLDSVLQLSADRSVDDRVVIWRDTLVQIADRPLLGSGLGTFMWGHLPYRSTSNGLPQHAHNEYLEALAETGMLGSALCVWFLLALGNETLRGLWRGPDGFNSGVCLGALAAWIGILVFAMTDFPTVIPATDYLLAASAGLALAGSGTRATSD